MNKITIKDFANNEIANQVYKMILNTNESVFLTGKAGTGKSAILTCIKTNTKKKLIILAPTAVAAKNVDGETIHSVFKIPTNAIKTKFKFLEHLNYSYFDLTLFNELELIVIDEISMVTSAMLDLIDRILKRTRKNLKPFGGVQMLLIGDPLQLSPVVDKEDKIIINEKWDSEFFFDANSYKKVIKNSFELTVCYRQNEEFFINFLDSLRINSLTNSQINEINKICLNNRNINEDSKIMITTHNKIVNTENQYRLGLLEGKLKKYISLEAGIVNKSECNADVELNLKKGAKVMFVKNNRKAGYTNGTLGLVLDLKEDIITVETQEGKTIEVKREEWITYENSKNSITGKLEKEAIGLFCQFPLKLGYSITTNKSQGMTFDCIQLDFRWGAFCPAQTYVAFSRAKYLDNISISSPLLRKDVFVDKKLLDFYNKNFKN